jgi:ATP-dependent Clp protease ATP-binding subunit ClpC
MRKRLIEINKERSERLNKGDFEFIDSLNKEENFLKKNISDFNREVEKDKTKYSINITLDNIATSISDMTNIPINKLTLNEKEKIANIENVLKESVVGQDEAIEAVSRIIKRNKVGLGDKNKTLGNLLLLGPSGSGKTLIAKKLAEEIFGSDKALVRIDMSEYSEKNSVAKLTGAAPGYVGFENGGQLTEAIKNKQHCVLLLDEIEKADKEVYNLFLQLFDEGRLTDSAGQMVNFKNVIVLMTSNIGAKQASEMGKGLGFVTDESSNKKSIIEKSLKQTFTPEFINRIDQIVYFNSLSEDNLKEIVKLEINKFIKRLNELNYNLTYTEEVVEHLHSFAIKQKEYGARPIIRLIQDKIEDQITDLMLKNEYEENYTFVATYENEGIIIK